ncbi:MAG: hypothetical protein FWE09_02805 [Treponema sp.]|nr:hypothetical protein [Treponema sp.]
MLNVEQVRQLETKIAKAINYVERMAKEKGELLHRDAELRARIDAHQRQEAELKARIESMKGRIEELESFVSRFKEEQVMIEDGILSALDRLSQFEKDMEKSLMSKPEGEARDEGEQETSGDEGAREDEPEEAAEDPEAANGEGGDNPGGKGEELDIF